MNSATQNPNPSSKYIGGLQVEFPYEPYGTQCAFMAKVISTLNLAERQGHSNALLESPTGTGKTLSLLCSVLAWQQNHSHSSPQCESPFQGYGKARKKKTTPTIFYATRTHSQISQVIREYRKTSYRVPMAILGSRKHYCTNEDLRGTENIDAKCKSLLKVKEPVVECLGTIDGMDEEPQVGVGCLEFQNFDKVKAHPSFQKGGCHEAHDIEDLLKVGQIVKGCSYFAARSMAEEAQLIFCSYSYIINPFIRRAMDIDLKDSIVILDEAHNIEDTAREAGSVDIEEDDLNALEKELGELRFRDSTVYQALHDIIQGIFNWITRKTHTLEERGFRDYDSSWTGDEAFRELQEIGIFQDFELLEKCAREAIRAASDAESLVCLSEKSVSRLQELFCSLRYFSRSRPNTFDYQLALRKYFEKASGKSTHCLSLSCLNPSVVFRKIADLSMSVILTSGTLSPMNSFSSELGLKFDTCFEAQHVIELKSQLWAAVVSTGPGNISLNASYKTSDVYAYQDDLGASLEEIFKIVPGGALVFFPSYGLMEKLRKRWEETGIWRRLNVRKSLFIEPKGDQNAFESVLRGYYDAIHRSKKSPPCETKMKDKQNHSTINDPHYSGAALLAVYRGKVSEGIDFSDEKARIVILVGIPFQNIHDTQVVQKKKYNDTYSPSKKLLSGNEWYCHQAFRALNQAAGRCIRHKFDYGAVIFLDERFREARNTGHVSKWLRNSINKYDSFDKSMEDLHSFFQVVEERIRQKINTTGSSYVKKEDNPIVATSNKLPDQVPSHLATISNSSRAVSQGTCAMKFSPEKVIDANFHDLKPKVELSPNWSIDYHTQESRNLMTSSPALLSSPADQFRTPDVKPYVGLRRTSSSRDVKRRIEFDSEAEFPEYERKLNVTGLCAANNTASPFSSSPAIHQRVHIYCPFCKNSLGLPENQYLVMCSVTSSSKVYLKSFRRGRPEHTSISDSESIPVVICDLSSVDQRLCNSPISNDASKHGIWSGQDGCVFSIVFCPFCSVSNRFLGVQIMATDASNIQLQNKILFYFDRVEIRNLISPKKEVVGSSDKG